MGFLLGTTKWSGKMACYNFILRFFPPIQFLTKISISNQKFHFYQNFCFTLSGAFKESQETKCDFGVQNDLKELHPKFIVPNCKDIYTNDGVTILVAKYASRVLPFQMVTKKS